MHKPHRQLSTAAVRHRCHLFLILLCVSPDIVTEGEDMDKKCCQGRKDLKHIAILTQHC